MVTTWLLHGYYMGYCIGAEASTTDLIPMAQASSELRAGLGGRRDTLPLHHEADSYYGYDGYHSYHGYHGNLPGVGRTASLSLKSVQGCLAQQKSCLQSSNRCLLQTQHWGTCDSGYNL